MRDSLRAFHWKLIGHYRAIRLRLMLSTPVRKFNTHAGNILWASAIRLENLSCKFHSKLTDFEYFTYTKPGKMDRLIHNYTESLDPRWDDLLDEYAIECENPFDMMDRHA